MYEIICSQVKSGSGRNKTAMGGMDWQKRKFKLNLFFNYLYSVPRKKKCCFHDSNTYCLSARDCLQLDWFT